jgi:hypothetical protein
MDEVGDSVRGGGLVRLSGFKSGSKGEEEGET